MVRFLVTGARQRMSRLGKPEWHLFEEAQVVELDTETGSVRVRLTYRTPPELCPEQDPSHVFKCASLDADELVLTTQTEALLVDARTMAIESRYSSPAFNDVHHAARIDGRIYVVSTGLDCVIGLDEDGRPTEFRDVLGGNVWDRFNPEADYRRIPTTKPHASHPNFVFQTEQGLWATRFEQRDAICLDRPDLRVDINVGMPHDGIAHDGALWFTTVNGHVIQADPATGRVLEDHDLNALDDREQPLGWCRGLTFVDGIAFVGFSHLRQTQIRRNVAWVKSGFRRDGSAARLPTRVAAYDLMHGALIGEWSVESVKQDVVFSVLPIAT